MDYSIYRLNLDVKTNRSQALLKVFKGDTAVKLVCMLTDGGRVFQLKDGNVATITLMMPGRSEPITHTCYILDNSIVYTFTGETTNIGADSSGVVEAQLYVYGGVKYDNEGTPTYSQTLATPKFSIEVSATANKPTNPIFEGINTSVGIVLGAAAQESARMLAENAREENETVRQKSYTEAEKTAKEAKEIALSAIPIPPDVVLGNKGAVVVRDADGKYSFVRCSSNGAINSVVVSDEKGRITLNNYPEQPTHATNKNYVDLGLSQTGLEARNYTDEKVEASHHDIEKRLDQLESVTLKYTEYSGVTDAVPVPENAAKYALVNKVGGMTYKSKNLIPYPYIDASLPKTVGTSTTLYGVTFTLNADRSLTLNGVSESYFDIYFTNAVSFTKGISISFGTPLEGLCEARYDLDAGDGFLMPEHIDIGTGSNVVLGAYDTAHVYLSIFQGATFNNVTIRPMLADSDVVLPYSDNFEGLRDTKVTELVSEGANLLSIQAEVSTPSDTNSNNTTPRTLVPNTIVLGMAHNNYYNPDAVSLISRTKDSITFTNRNGYGLSFYFELKPNTKYTISCKSSIDILQTAVLFYNVDGTVDYFEADRVTSKTFTTNYCGKTLIVFVDINASYGDNTTVTLSDVMLNEGTTAVPYKPYRSTLDTLPISAEIQSLEGYGKGVEGYPNYIDFERKVFVQNTYRKVFDGTEDILDGGLNTEGQTRYSFRLDKQAKESDAEVLCVSSHYSSVSINNTYRGSGNLLGVNGNYIRWIDAEIPTFSLAEMQAKLKAWYGEGNPLIVEYAMATPPKPINISKYPTDDEIEVEGGGTIVPDNSPAFVEMLFTEKK